MVDKSTYEADTVTLSFSCTTCPSECTLTVSASQDADGTVTAIHSVEGNRCPRGGAFARQELTCPMRVLTSTVQVRNGEDTLVPVRTATAIPLAIHADAMDAIRTMAVDAPVSMGDVIAADLLGSGVDLIASMDIPAKPQFN